MKYPNTKTVAQQDDFFGTTVIDPYRWLENDTAQEVADWVDTQIGVTNDYLATIPFREQIKKRLEELWNYEKFSSPTREGDYYYFFRNDGLQNQSVMYRQKGLEGEPEVFLDPNTFSADGTVAFAGGEFSKDGKYFAYQVTESGSDWRNIFVMDVASKQLISDSIKWAKFTGISWKGEEGFFYSTYDRPAEGKELSNINTQHKLYFHRLGTPQSADELVFGGQAQPYRYIFGGVSDDGRFLFINGAINTNGNALFFKDLQKNNSPIVPMVENTENNHAVIHTEGETFFIQTDLDAPNQRIMTTTAAQPRPSNWKVLVPEKPEVLEGASFAGGKMFLNYLKDATTRIYQHDLKGALEKEVVLPALGSASGMNGKKEDLLAFYSFTSFAYPTTIYAYDIATGESRVFRQPKVQFSPDAFETKQVFYTSKDGTKVPMFIVHKKGLVLDGQNPTQLYGYGGFNVSLTPSFSPRVLFWLEKGGVYAMPNLRGGGEYGTQWHDGGRQFNKQNVFDDFIAAAEYLKAEGYTSKEKLSINGGSNGGLLVGATMTQRPDLCQVAIPAVGVLDMLRYHQFTAGAGWIYDYGCADSSQAMFDYLYKYSPVHNVKQGTSYPATLVTTADHDDRVVPAHSFKFISELQAKQSGDNPVLIRIDKKAGHGSGKPTSKQIEEAADVLSFTYFNMKVNPIEELNPEK